MTVAIKPVNRIANKSADPILKNLTDPLIKTALEELWGKAKRRHLKVADLFCGAGGTSTGLIKACEKLGFTVELTAVNHWDVAIATHTKNHPRMKHLCTNVDDVDPRSLYKEGELDILWSSPECIMHSRARGGKPVNDQRRISAWSVCRWAEALQPPIILVENVMEFLDWGPVNKKGKPIKALRGTTYRAWKMALESLGYRVEERVLCAADYGDPTIRRRVFIYAVRGKRSVIWPEPTHAEPAVLTQIPDGDLFGLRRRPWVTAKEIIDWHIPGTSIFDRGTKKDLVEKTIRRIGIGLDKFVFAPMLDKRQRAGFSAEDFILPQFGESAPRSVDSAMSTLTTQSRGNALIRPSMREMEPEFLVPQQSGNPPRSVHLPIPTVTATGNGHVKINAKLKKVSPKVNPETACITHARGTSTATSIHHPHPSVTSREHLGVAAAKLTPTEPTPEAGHKNSYLTEYYKSGTAGSIDQPVEAVTAQGVKQAITTSVLIPRVGVFGQNQPRGIDKPMPTAIAAHPMASVATAVLVETKHGNGESKNGDGHRAKSMESTMGAVTSKNGMAVAEAQLSPADDKAFILGIDHKGSAGGTSNSQTRGIDQPVSTVITKQKHGLVSGVILPHPRTHGDGPKSMEDTMGTVTATSSDMSLATAHLSEGQGDPSPETLTAEERRNRDIPRLVGYYEHNKAKVKLQLSDSTEIGLADYLVLYYGSNQSNSIDAPMPSATTHDRVGVISVKAVKPKGKKKTEVRKRMRPLIEIDGQIWELDILFRMLNCRELARTQGFPEDYQFTGTKTETVAQIGNAVPCHLAEALGLSAVLSLFHSKANLTPFDLEGLICPEDCPAPYPLPEEANV